MTISLSHFYGDFLLAEAALQQAFEGNAVALCQKDIHAEETDPCILIVIYFISQIRRPALGKMIYDRKDGNLN